MATEIPHGWAQVSLGELLQLIRNGTTAVQQDEPTPYPVTRIETISEGVIDRSRVKYLFKPEPAYLLAPGDILYSHINSLAHMGKVALYTDSAPLYHGMNLMLLRPRFDRIEPRFLFAVLAFEPSRAHARREAKSAINQASLGQGDIKALTVLLPPLPEQRRIAEILDTVDAAIQQTETLIDKLKLMKAGLLRDLLTRGLDEHGRLRDPIAHPEQFKDSPLGRIPREWNTPTFEDITAGDAPICYGIVQPGPYVESGIPVLAIHNLGGNYSTNIHKCAPSVERQYARSRILPNDVLLSVKGSIGRVGVVPQWFVGNISRDVARIRLKPLASPQYIYQMLLAPASQHRLEMAMVGTTRAEISIWILKQLRLPLPPVREQERIASVLSIHDFRIRAEEAYYHKIKQLKFGLMRDLLTGQVRVQEEEEAQ